MGPAAVHIASMVASHSCTVELYFSK